MLLFLLYAEVYLPVDKPRKNSRPTRDILHVSGLLLNRDTLDVLVAHFPSPVSYTHLDVYKRQVQGNGQTVTLQQCPGDDTGKRIPRSGIMGRQVRTRNLPVAVTVPVIGLSLIHI